MFKLNFLKNLALLVALTPAVFAGAGGPHESEGAEAASRTSSTAVASIASNHAYEERRIAETPAPKAVSPQSGTSKKARESIAIIQLIEKVFYIVGTGPQRNPLRGLGLQDVLNFVSAFPGLEDRMTPAAFFLYNHPSSVELIKELVKLYTPQDVVSAPLHPYFLPMPSAR